MDKLPFSIVLERLKTLSNEHYKLPERYLKTIAQNAYRKNIYNNESLMIQELERLNTLIERYRNRAQKHGYAPFTNMGQQAYNWIKKNCSQWVLDRMAIALKEPEDIHPEWGVQCAKTMSLIGRQICEQQDNLYSFITNHPEWNHQKVSRLIFRKYKSRLQYKYYKKPSSQN